jgi:hypothetical protein
MTRNEVPPVPAGMVRLAEYGSYPPEHDAIYTKVADAVGAIHSYPTVTLRHVTRGYVPAGSCARWDEARWCVTYCMPDGSRHGQSFLECDEDKARTYFEKITNPIAVSARRQEDEYLEQTVYAPARAKAEAERLAREAAEKTRKAARRKDLARQRKARQRAAD